MSQKFCTYTFVSGPQKGHNCNRFCRKGRDLCYSHHAQTNKFNKKVLESKEPIEKKEEKEVHQKVQLLKLNDNVQSSKGNLSESGSSSTRTSSLSSTSSD